MPDLSGVQLGTLPDWLAAVGTVGAFIAALFILNKELTALREARAEKIREAASGVSAWWDWESSSATLGRSHPAEVGMGYQGYLTGFWAVRARNGGGEPVYNCIVYLGPRQLAGAPPLNFFFPIIPPGATLTEAVKEDDEVFLNSDDINAPQTWTEIFFRDASGRNWRRRWNGTLEQVRDMPGLHSPPNDLVDLRPLQP